MAFQFESTVERWIKRDPLRGALEVSYLVAELFALVGKPLPMRGLMEVRDHTQGFLRLPDKERWHLDAIPVADLPRLKDLAVTLGLHDPVPASRQEYELIVILGGALGGMRQRLAAVVEQNLRCDELVALTCQRPINEAEQSIFRAAGIDPAGKTETDSALLLFATDRRPKAEGVGVIETANPKPGKRATTDETIAGLNEVWLVDNQGTRVLFVSHAPFGLRQTCTVRRVLGNDFTGHQIDFCIGGLTKPLEQMTGVLLDEVCRTIFEIAQLPPEILAG